MSLHADLLEQDHGEMLKASRSFSGGNLPVHIVSATGAMTITLALQDVATAFVDLQQVRHRADYDLMARFSRTVTIGHVEQVQRAFDDWNVVRNEPAARLYLVALFAWDEFRK